MGATIEQKRERQRISRQRKKLRQRIERARFRCGRHDWIVTETELDAILAGENPKKTECLPAKPSEPASVVELPPIKLGAHLSTHERAEQVLNLIHSGVQTWDALAKETRLDDESLGLALMDLFHERRIRSYDVGEVRMYAVR